MVFLIPVEVFDFSLLLGQMLYIRREKSKIQDVEVNFMIQTVITVCMSFKVLKMKCLGREKGL